MADPEITWGKPLVGEDGQPLQFNIPHPPETYRFVWMDGSDHRPMLTFHRDGRVELGDSFTPDEGARLLLESLRYHFSGWIGGGTECPRADFAPTDAQVMAHPKVRALVEAIARAADEIDRLNTLPPDESGCCWSASDLLDQEVMGLRAALRNLEDGTP